MNKSRTAPTQTLATGARAWAWPLRIPAYDRGDTLTAAKQRILLYGFSGAMRTERKASVILNQLAGVGRLLTPINDALAAVEGEGGCSDRVKEYFFISVLGKRLHSGHATTPSGAR